MTTDMGPVTAQARDPARDQRIAKLTEDGLTAEAIAAELGVTARTVQRARVRRGVAKPAARRMTAEDLRRARELLDDGASLGEVSRTIGRDLHTIGKHFPGCGWPRGSGIELRRMMAALEAIPPNVVTLCKAYHDPGQVSIAGNPLGRMYAALNAIPEVVS